MYSRLADTPIEFTTGSQQISLQSILSPQQIRQLFPNVHHSPILSGLEEYILSDLHSRDYTLFGSLLVIEHFVEGGHIGIRNREYTLFDTGSSVELGHLTQVLEALSVLSESEGDHGEVVEEMGVGYSHPL